MKNIVIIGDFCYPNYMGGSSKHVYDLLCDFPLYHCKVKLLTRKRVANKYSASDSDAQLVYDQYKNRGDVIELSTLGIFNALNYINFVRNADYVLLQHPIMGCIGGFISKLFRKKVIYHYHGPLHLEYKMKVGNKNLRYYVLWWLQKMTIIFSDKVLTHSNYMKEVAIKEHSVPQTKCIYLPPYINSNNVSNKRLHLPFLKNECSKIHLLIPRRLTARTGVVEFLEAFLSLSDNVRNKVQIYISGRGELRTVIEKLVSKDPDNISYVGFLSYEELWTLYNQIDAVVVPSLDLEGFGYVILEAMSCGASALVSQTCGGGFEFIMKHLGTNYTFNTYSSESVLKALNTISKKEHSRDYYMKIANSYTTEAMIRYYVDNILI